jgi:hypothetical protein
MRFTNDAVQKPTPEGFVDAVPLAMVCEKPGCNRHAVADCKRKSVPLWAKALAYLCRIRIDYAWQNEPIALCEEHAFGHIVIDRFMNNDGKVVCNED